jgi:hypothetical protein
VVVLDLETGRSHAGLHINDESDAGPHIFWRSAQLVVAGIGHQDWIVETAG